MGLFTNKKKLCPICGNPTPRIFPTAIEGQPLCKECKNKIELPNDLLDNMTLEDFKRYLADFEQNSALWPLFNETHRFSFTLSDILLLDENNGFIKLDVCKRWVIEKKYLKSFRILEDNKLLFESGNGTLNIYRSDIPDRVMDLAPAIDQFTYDRREYERRAAREDALNRGKETDEERMERQRINNMYKPTFDVPRLFDNFRVILTFKHPYWTTFDDTVSAPKFNESYPSADDYMREYDERCNALYELASRLMKMIDPRYKESRIGFEVESQSYAAALADTVTELKRYKELLEQGIITEEEFTAKKRQLLGL